MEKENEMDDNPHIEKSEISNSEGENGTGEETVSAEENITSDLQVNGNPEESPENVLEDQTEEIPESSLTDTSEVPASEEHQVPEAPAESEDISEQKHLPQNDNVAYVGQQIDKLINLKNEHNFTDFWFYVKELNKMVFTLRGLQKEERLKFKDRISELCDEVKKVQDELKAKVAKTSQIKLDRIKELLAEALTFGTSPEEMERSFQRIDETNKFLREGVVKSEDGEESADMSREHREEAKEAIKTARDKIFDRKRELREANFKKVTDRLTKLSDQLMAKTPAGKIFDGVKHLRAEMKAMALDRSQVREIDNVIETIWKKAKEKLSAGRENETKSKLTWLENGLRRKTQFIQTLEKEIKELNIKWASVQNDFFKNRVNEWIEEKKEKIETTQKEIESAREKIKFLHEQLERK